MGSDMKIRALLPFLLLAAFPAFADVAQEPGTGQRNMQRDLAINFPPDNPQGASIAVGQYAMPSPAVGNSGGQINLAIGYQSMRGAMTPAAQNNLCIGYNACKITSGSNNIVVGTTTSGTSSQSRNIMMGAIANQNAGGGDYVHLDPEGSVSAFSGSLSVVIGTHIGYSQIGGTIVGDDCFYSDINSGTGYNTAFGANVARTNIGSGGTVPTQVILFGGNGNSPQSAIIDGASSATVSAIGFGLAHPGTNDTAIGWGALIGNTANTSKNSALGRNALTALTTGTNSVGFGFAAGSSITTGSNNSAFGYNVGSATLTTGGGNILIGTSSAVTTPAAGSANEINIGGLLIFNNASTAVPVISACGTSPAVDSKANAASGMVTAGSGVLGSCTITFASAYTTWNHCQVTSQAGNIAGFAYSYTTSAITITGTSITSDVFDYKCDGF